MSFCKRQKQSAGTFAPISHARREEIDSPFPYRMNPEHVGKVAK